MKIAWTALAILAALCLQSALGVLAPAHARAFDPFILVVVYCGLTGGESHGMLAGMAAGWVQDIHFGGPVVGPSALTKLVVGFGVGLAASRFLISGTAPRLLTLFVAGIADAWLLERLAAVFDLPLGSMGLLAQLSRAAVNAVAGVVAFELVELRPKGRLARP
jgi:cell shape-determining protein MreD